jgi:hypothetical protein
MSLWIRKEHIATLRFEQPACSLIKNPLRGPFPCLRFEPSLPSLPRESQQRMHAWDAYTRDWRKARSRDDNETHARDCEAKRNNARVIWNEWTCKSVRERRIAIGLDESASFLLVWLRSGWWMIHGRNIVGMRIDPRALDLSPSNSRRATRFVGERGLPDHEISVEMRSCLFFLVSSNILLFFMLIAESRRDSPGLRPLMAALIYKCILIYIYTMQISLSDEMFSGNFRITEPSWEM